MLFYLSVNLFFYGSNIINMPIPVAVRPKTYICRRSIAGIACSNSLKTQMFVSCVCCLLGASATC
jgi:hypothetical protein